MDKDRGRGWPGAGKCAYWPVSPYAACNLKQSMRLKQLLSDPGAPSRDAGILLLRVGLGIMFVGHGYPKLAGGPDTWQVYGEAMRHVGIPAAPLLWGFLAGLAELGGGILFGLGLLFRPACLVLAVTMLIATVNHLAQGDGFIPASHPVEAGLVFLAFLFIGPGRWSLDARLARKIEPRKNSTPKNSTF